MLDERSAGRLRRLTLRAGDELLTLPLACLGVKQL
jgi:hypothetical protein